MADRFLRHAGPVEIVRKLTAKAVIDHTLIEDGDNILIAASGGKDSTTMAWALSSLRKSLKQKYGLAAVHISSDFCACCKKGVLQQRLDEWEIPFTDISVPVIGRLKPGRKMNCYWCSTQRRTELLKYAIGNGFNKIALGHHLDDMIETFFMNLADKGVFSIMPVFFKYDKYPVSLIRPLALLEETQIIACADEMGILKAACTCPYGINSRRRGMRKRLADFTRADGEGSTGAGAVKRHILKALLEKEKCRLQNMN